MKKFMNEILYDAKFIKGHTLQPQWYKILKVFLLLGLIGCYYLIFGGIRTLVFFGCFFGLSLVVHMVYRIKTNKFTQSWLDFRISDNNGQLKYQRIGIYYYLAVAINGVISLLISQLLVS
jgi:hypothetical protein